jgi:hypothetical protein
MRTNNLWLFSILIFLFISISCTDIANTDKNINVVTIGEEPGLSKWIIYRFATEVLSYKNNDTTFLWSTLIPSNWAKNFNIVNSFQDSILEISSVKLLDGTNFSITPYSSLPLKLIPNQSNTKNLIFVYLDTKNLTQGIYIDKIILNNNPNIGFYIRVNVR